MPLEEFIIPNEKIIFKSGGKVEYKKEKYILYITDRRLLLYRRAGTIFKRDRVVSEDINRIAGITYEERGLIQKKSIVEVEVNGRKLEFRGSPDILKNVYLNLQSRIGDKEDNRKNL